MYFANTTTWFFHSENLTQPIGYRTYPVDIIEQETGQSS